MINITVENVLKATNGKLVKGTEEQIITTISTDTRKLKKGEFFIAFEGEKFDGHDFVVEAYKKGASGIIVQIDKLRKVRELFKKAGYPRYPSEFTIIKVEDTVRAFGKIAGFYRRRFRITAVAITGSNGKTTTKELTYTFLSQIFSRKELLKSEKNYNNEIGIPLTVFKITPETKILVAELGINHIGEMDRLAYIVDPDYGLITNIGDTHLEFLKNNKIVAKAKGELISHVKKTIFLNYDDYFFNYFKNLAKVPVISFSLNNELNEDNIIHFDYYESLGLDGWLVGYKGIKMRFKLPGEHNLYNLLSALSIAEKFEVPLKKIKSCVENFKPVEQRGEIINRKNYKIYFDAYNANPSSTRALLYFLHNLNHNGKKIAILGDMMELGKKAMKYHTEVLQYAEKLNIDSIYTYGEIYKRVHRERPVAKERFKSFVELSSLVKELKKEIEENTLILIKGSRKMEMERLLDFI